MGVRTINLTPTSLADDLIVNREGSTARQPIASLAMQLFAQFPTSLLGPGRTDIDSIADLETRFVYAGPEAGQETISAGDVVFVRGTLAVFEAVATDATNVHIDHTVSGGCKFRVRPILGSYVAEHFPSLRAAFTAAATESVPLVLQGDYTVTERLLEVYTGTANLYVFCQGAVRIIVGGSTHLGDLIVMQSSVINNCHVLGGSLEIVGNNLIRVAFYIRHTADQDGGEVILQGYKSRGCTNTVSTPGLTGGLAIIGRYVLVDLDRPDTADVTRVTGVVSPFSNGGECFGIAISQLAGTAIIRHPRIARIFTGPSLGDADGLKVFGHMQNGDGYQRRGRVIVIAPQFEDCQGRMYKDQVGNSVVLDADVRRDASVCVSIASSVEFDFQEGSGQLIRPRFRYRKDGSTSPIGSSHSLWNFNQKTQDAEMVARVERPVVETDVQIPRAGSVLYLAGAQRGDVQIDLPLIQPFAGYSGPVFRDALVEVDLGPFCTSPAKMTKARVAVNGARGPIGHAAIAYRGYDGVADLSGLVSFEVHECVNTETTTMRAAVQSIANSPVLHFERLSVRDNTGFRDNYEGAIPLDWSTLDVGSSFTINIANVVVNTSGGKTAPAWGASGYARVECLGQWYSATDRTIRVTLLGGSKFWLTSNSGVSWTEWSAP